MAAKPAWQEHVCERISFYFDEHIPQSVAAGLLRRGVDVLTVQMAGRTGLTDPEQLDFAAQQGRVMVRTVRTFLLGCSKIRAEMIYAE